MRRFLLVLVVVACGGGNASKTPALRAPSSVVAPLTPASPAVEFASVHCSPRVAALVEVLETKVDGVPECGPFVEKLEGIIADNCRTLDAAILSETATLLDTCTSAAKTAGNKSMSALASFKMKQLDQLKVIEPPASVPTGVSFETFVLNAVTDFVVARAKAEVLNWVANEFGSAICKHDDSNHIDVASYFPSTCRIFTKADGKVEANLQDFGRALQAAMQRDLRDAIGRLVNGAVAHLDPRLRLLAVFVTDYFSSKSFKQATARADEQTRCDANRELCWLKLGLYVLAELESTTVDKPPVKFLAALDAAIVVSPDEALRAEWKRWRKNVESVVAIATSATDAKAALEGALAKPPNERIWSAEEALYDFVRALAQHPPDSARNTELFAVATRFTVAHEWIEFATTAYRVIDGVRRGEEPLGLVISAGRGLRCYKRRDLVCALKVGFLFVEAISDTVGWDSLRLDDLSALAIFATQASKTFDMKLAALTDGTPAWFKANVALRATEQVALVKSVFQQARRVADIVRTAYAPAANGQPLSREELARKAHDLLDATHSVFALASTLSLRHTTLAAEHVARAQQVVDDMFGAWSALADGDAGQFIVSLTAVAEGLGIANALPASIRKYVPLVTAVASAKDSADIKAALDKYAAPVGGYKEKRKRSWMGSVSAFVGVGGGGEQLDAKDDSDFHGHVGLFAPVGIDLACGKGHWCDGAGVLLSIIDIGNLVSVRIDEVDAPDPSFEQVFSPGIYGRWNLVGPFSVGGGIAAVPEMRRPHTKDDSDEPDAVGGFKAVVFIAADVTIFPF